MTRKQALMRVCELLATYPNMCQDSERQELINKIQEVIKELPITNWSKETIFDTIDNWIIENGRVPTSRDMARKGLPPIPVIKNRFKMNCADFLHKYYPRNQLCNSTRYWYKTVEEWDAIFKSEFKRIKPSSSNEYNDKRNKEYPTWYAMATMHNLTKWNELLDYYKLRPYKTKRQHKRKPSLQLQLQRVVDVPIKFSD